MSFAAIMLGGMLAEAILSWPAALFTRIGHPVTWLGRLINWCEARVNYGTRAKRLIGGGFTVFLVIAAAVTPAYVLQTLLPGGVIGWLFGAALVWPFVALRSLYDHVQAVADPLSRANLPAARRAVSMIAGRDPDQLDTAGIARTAMESLAENTSDGVVAPLFWGLIAGLPGIAGYKAINTLDSMIGHRNDRYEAFGKIAARLDDIVNWIPARLTGLLFALASGPYAQRALTTMRRDAPAHRSPNAGWPEGAMAGALNIRLSGPRVYGDRIANEPWLNGTAPDPGARALMDGLALYRRAMVLLALALLALALF